MNLPLPSPLSRRRTGLAVLLAALTVAPACHHSPSTTSPTGRSTVRAPRTTAPRTTAAPQPGTSVPTAPKTDGVRGVSWTTFTYDPDVCQDYQSRPDWLDVKPVPDPEVVYGDLTGDGREEAVVTLDCDSGGSLHWSSIWIYTGDTTAANGVRRLVRVDPLRNAQPALDARDVESVTVANGRVTTRWRVYLADDANCCPSRRATVTQHWTGTALFNDGPPQMTDAPAN